LKKKLLVTGSAGFVAGSVIAQALPFWEVYALDRIKISYPGYKFSSYKSDLTESVHLEELYNQIKPDAVIHTAALADIDYCQNNQEEAEKVNVKVTKKLANLCKKNKARIIICSTDTVFDGKKGSYKEEDEPVAVNFYAETKIRAEKLIQELDFNAVITRLSLVIGLPVLGSGNSFLDRTIRKLEKGEQVPFPQNEIRTPIDVVTLGAALVELARNNYRGILHLAGNDRINRYEMACQIASKLGYSSDLIVASNSNSFSVRAPRPNDNTLNNGKAQKILSTPMLSLEQGLQLTLNFGK